MRTPRESLRKRRYGKYGVPDLVIPVPVIGGLPEGYSYDARLGLVFADVPHTEEDDFLWCPDVAEDGKLKTRLGQRVSPGPSDEEWVERYKAFRTVGVRYDPEEAQTRLLGLVTNERQSPITKFTIEPIAGPERNNVTISARAGHPCRGPQTSRRLRGRRPEGAPLEPPQGGRGDRGRAE